MPQFRDDFSQFFFSKNFSARLGGYTTLRPLFLFFFVPFFRPFFPPFFLFLVLFLFLFIVFLFFSFSFSFLFLFSAFFLIFSSGICIIVSQKMFPPQWVLHGDVVS